MAKVEFSREQASECVAESKLISEAMRQEILSLRDEILRKFPKDDGRKFTDVSLAKFYLVIPMQLAGQICLALESGMTYLAAIGFRNLQETEINAKYIFRHPKHRKDSTWVRAIAKDFFKRSKLIMAQKNQLNGVSLKQRAKEVRKLGVYNKPFAISSGYSHGLAGASILNDDSVFYTKTVELTVVTLCLLHNTAEYVATFYDLKRDPTNEKALLDLVDRWALWTK